MSEQADTPLPKGAPVAHAPEWMVREFGMEKLVEAGVVVSEPSPGVTVRQVGKQLVPVPPKSEWKVYRVVFVTDESGVLYTQVDGDADRIYLWGTHYTNRTGWYIVIVTPEVKRARSLMRRFLTRWRKAARGRGYEHPKARQAGATYFHYAGRYLGAVEAARRQPQSREG